jgi:hypothetical protein
MLKIIPLFLAFVNISCFEDKKENNPKSGTVDLKNLNKSQNQNCPRRYRFKVLSKVMHLIQSPESKN